jgi:HEAT repeat protein
MLVAAVVNAQPPVAAARKVVSSPLPPGTVRFQPTKKEPDKKEPDKKEPTKPPEIKWPTDINGKDIKAVMKDMEDPDPTIREFAVRTLPLFGPPAQKKEVSKLLLKRMTGAEPDPGVRIAVFNTVGQIQFEDEEDNRRALQLLVQYVDAPVGGSASLYRLHAVQTLSLFGPKGSGAITALTGIALKDPSFETRRSIANTLGRVGFSETTGPNMKALRALANVLAKDDSASVRMEAMQSLMLLGPPWAAVMKAGAKMPPPIKKDEAEEIVKYMKSRVGDPKATPKPLPPLEKDPQVEIWARLVLMRFDPREVNEDNLDALAKYLTNPQPAIKVQALNAIGIIGELAAKKLDAVVRVLEEKNAPFNQTVACVQVLVAMGAGAKPAIPNLQKMVDARRKELKEKELELAKKKDDPQLTGEKFALEEMVKLLDAAIKHIDKATPTSPGGAGDPPPKKP